MTLSDRQALFTSMLGDLLGFPSRAYRVRIREAYRPTEMAQIYAARGLGIANSLHTLSLAVDLVLDVWDPEAERFVYETSADHPHWLELGEYWESLHPQAAWGGRFERKDAGHFSLTIPNDSRR